MTDDLPTLRDLPSAPEMAWAVDLAPKGEPEGVLVENGRVVAWWRPGYGWEAAVVPS